MQGTFVGDVHEAVLLAKLLPRPSSDQPVRFIDYSAPILDESGRVKGVLGAHAHWDWAGALLSTIAPANTTPENFDLFIFNDKGEVIHPENLPPELKAPRLDALGSAPRERFMAWDDTSLYLTASAGVQNPVQSNRLGWHVVVRQGEDSVLAEVRSLQRVNLLTHPARGDSRDRLRRSRRRRGIPGGASRDRRVASDGRGRDDPRCGRVEPDRPRRSGDGQHRRGAGAAGRRQ
nr:cache domain-containing protein [Cupriavidus sp. AU9028]